MDRNTLRNILIDIKNNKINIDKASNLLISGGFINIDHTKLDIERSLRTGFPEVVFCESKELSELMDIVTKLLKEDHFSMLTRLNAEQFKSIEVNYKNYTNITYHRKAKIAIIGIPAMKKRGLVSILSAGTSDMPIAEEAAITAETFGCKIKKFYDVGIAGIHRLLNYWDDIKNSNVIIAIAGMEGALPSVVAGLYGGPVIAVPTSVGYGTNFSGITPLLSMLNSCSPGVSVVNIDNGFGAGFIASSINKRIEDARENE